MTDGKVREGENAVRKYPKPSQMTGNCATDSDWPYGVSGYRTLKPSPGCSAPSLTFPESREEVAERRADSPVSSGCSDEGIHGRSRSMIARLSGGYPSRSVTSSQSPHERAGRHGDTGVECYSCDTSPETRSARLSSILVGSKQTSNTGDAKQTEGGVIRVDWVSPLFELMMVSA